MLYPRIEEVMQADRLQLCRWYRFLPSPRNTYNRLVMDRIVMRFNAFGGFTPAISKQLGFEKAVCWEGDDAVSAR